MVQTAVSAASALLPSELTDVLLEKVLVSSGRLQRSQDFAIGGQLKNLAHVSSLTSVNNRRTLDVSYVWILL